MMRRYAAFPSCLALLVLSACQAAPSVTAPAHAPALAPLTQRPAGKAADTRGDLAAPDVVPNEWMVELRPGVRSRDWLASSAPAGLALRDELRIGRSTWVVMRASAGLDAQEAETRLRASRDVVSVSPHGRAKAAEAPAEASLSALQWGNAMIELDAVGAEVPRAQQENVIVAIVDGGLDLGHEEFTGRVVSPRNLLGEADDDEVYDANGHGTHCAGIIGADADNGVGIAGVAPGVKLMPVKVLDPDGYGDDIDVLQGLQAAIDYEPPPGQTARVRVVNLSLGSVVGGVARAYQMLYDRAVSRGVMLVAAAGNDGLLAIATPANTMGGISVGATTHYFGIETLAPFSNRHRLLDVTAPGQHIVSTVPRHVDPSGYLSKEGTSMATPFVAGVAALAIAKYDPEHAGLNPEFWTSLYDRLTSAVDDLGPPGKDPAYGYGRINARKALSPATIDDPVE